MDIFRIEISEQGKDWELCQEFTNEDDAVKRAGILSGRDALTRVICGSHVIREFAAGEGWDE